MNSLTVGSKTVKCTEEVIRWRFEVALECRTLENGVAGTSFVAFTNPTAGPWKRVVGPKLQESYEIYRFGSKESRPDVIVVSDLRRRIYVLEAKDEAAKLTTQVIKKTYEIAGKFNVVFGAFGNHEDWAPRKSYVVSVGFVFSSKSVSAAVEQHGALMRRVVALGELPGDTYSAVVIDIDGSLEVSEFCRDELSLLRE